MTAIILIIFALGLSPIMANLGGIVLVFSWEGVTGSEVTFQVNDCVQIFVFDLNPSTIYTVEVDAVVVGKKMSSGAGVLVISDQELAGQHVVSVKVTGAGWSARPVFMGGKK